MAINWSTFTVGELRRILSQYDDADPVYVAHRDANGDPYLERTSLECVVSTSRGNEHGLAGMDHVDGRYVNPPGVRIHTHAYEAYAAETRS
jgi:hypothetical protein